jgi:hypothetical protein
MSRRHGSQATIVAVQRADECLAAGNIDGQATWKRIVDAVLEFLREKPRDGESRN